MDASHVLQDAKHAKVFQNVQVVPKLDIPLQELFVNLNVEMVWLYMELKDVMIKTLKVEMDALLHANNKMDMYVLDNLQHVFQISQLIQDLQQSAEMELLKPVNLVMT